jgi:hypothetical protein
MSDYPPAPAPTARVKLAALRSFFPDFSFDVLPGPGPVFEARRVHGHGHLYSVASTSAKELRKILMGRC